jgi:hypothetical protein
MLSRTERIDEFHLKVTRTEKELYEEFLKTEEAALSARDAAIFCSGEKSCQRDQVR